MKTNHLFDGLLDHADRERLFARMPGEPTRYYSYSHVFDVSARLANRLVKLGLTPGERVAVQIPKSIEAVMLYLATVRAGGVFLPLNTAYTTTEIEYFLGDATPRIFVCDPASRETFEPLAEQMGFALETMGVWRDEQTFAGTLLADGLGESAGFDTVERGPEDLAAILYTSGTTGRSKGAMLSHDNLLSNARVLADLWQFSRDDVLLHALPIFHTHGLFVATNIAMVTGGAMIFLERFDARSVMVHLPDATAMMGVPTFYTRLLEEADFNRELVGHMRLFVSGSAPLLAETHVEFEKRTGKRILERYGMTETNMNTSNPCDGERRAGTVGFPLPGTDLRVVDPETGAELPQGEVGVIEVKGPNVFAGYWQMPEKTREEFRDDGFFITGDLGRIDEDGYLHIVGRAKDLIISGGYNIYPKEIELLLDDMPGVKESAVFGVPHTDFGEGVVAVLVDDGSGIDTGTIIEKLQGQLARFKQPKHLEVVDALPRNTMGKVQKNLLRERFATLFSG